jgi:biopolymer transport protein ExbB
MPLFLAKYKKAFAQAGLRRFLKRDPQSYPQIMWTRTVTRWRETAPLFARLFAQDLPLAAARAKVSCLNRFQGKSVFSIVLAAGWPIWPLLFVSIVAVALIIERLGTLRRAKVLPTGLLQRVLADYRQKGMTEPALIALEAHSPLGQVLAAGLRNVGSSREIMREAIEETGGVVAHRLERYLTTLGTIASISPLMGLFGTVVGMIEIFGSQAPTGGNPVQLAHGISVALYNTGFGLLIAIPSMFFWRHFRALVNGFVIDMQQQAVRLVEVLHGERPT